MLCATDALCHSASTDAVHCCRHLRRKISTTITKHPDTPDVTQICSKRSFDGQAKKWRRELHLWDPEDEEDLLEPVMVCMLEFAFQQLVFCCVMYCSVHWYQHKCKQVAACTLCLSRKV